MSSGMTRRSGGGDRDRGGRGGGRRDDYDDYRGRKYDRYARFVFSRNCKLIEHEIIMYDSMLNKNTNGATLKF